MRELLARGADPAADPSPAPLLAIAADGSRNWEGDHVGVAELLVAAGEPLHPGLLEQAGGPLLSGLMAD